MDNLPQKNNFICNIKKFFYNLFNRKKTKSENNIEKRSYVEEKNIFTNQLKDDIKKIENKRYIIEKFENNSEFLDSFSIERLEQLENIYDEIILENNITLKELEFKINSYKKI